VRRRRRRRRFDEAVAEVRAAVADGDGERATNALDGLALHALAAHEDGTIDDDELSEVAELIESSKALVGQVVPTTTTTTIVVFEESDDDKDEGDKDDKDDEDNEDDGPGNGRGKKDD
jgi:hypothetical protein